MSYLSSYEVELEIGFALLEKVEGPQGPEFYQSVPDEGSFENLLLTGVYGGSVDPEEIQDFLVYSVQWPEDLGEFDEDLLELLSEELDSLFPGWIYDQKRDRIYILQSLEESDFYEL